MRTNYIKALDRFGTKILGNNEAGNKQKPIDVLGEWVSKEFDFIPSSVVYTMYAQKRECLLRIDSNEQDDRFFLWPAIAGMLLHPRDPELEAKIRNRPHLVSQFGFLVYDSPDFGILLAMDVRGFLHYSYQFAYMEQLLERGR